MDVIGQYAPSHAHSKWLFFNCLAKELSNFQVL